MSHTKDGSKESNAKLIDAATDLLEVSKTSLCYLEYAKDKGMVGEIDKDIQKTKQAIAKAESLS